MNINNKTLKFTVKLGAIIAIILIFTPSAFADNNPSNSSGVLPPYSYPFGKSYGDWSAKWWKWAISIPANNEHPFNDPNWDCGVSNHQQSGKVWYLVGAFTAVFPALPGTEKTYSCKIPTGKAIFFPVINTECSNVETGTIWYAANETDARQCAESLTSGPVSYFVDLEVIVDGKRVRNVERYRFQSPYFTYDLPQPNNILGASEAQGKSVSDGYWIMLAPLSKGSHTVTFRGRSVSDRSKPDGTQIFATDVTYNLTIVGEERP